MSSKCVLCDHTHTHNTPITHTHNTPITHTPHPHTYTHHTHTPYTHHTHTHTHTIHTYTHHTHTPHTHHTHIHTPYTHTFFPSVKKRLTQKIPIFPELTTMLTGHGNIKSYLYRLGLLD